LSDYLPLATAMKLPLILALALTRADALGPCDEYGLDVDELADASSRDTGSDRCAASSGAPALAGSSRQPPTPHCAEIQARQKREKCRRGLGEDDLPPRRPRSSARPLPSPPKVVKGGSGTARLPLRPAAQLPRLQGPVGRCSMGDRCWSPDAAGPLLARIRDAAGGPWAPRYPDAPCPAGAIKALHFKGGRLALLIPDPGGLTNGLSGLMAAYTAACQRGDSAAAIVYMYSDNTAHDTQGRPELDASYFLDLEASSEGIRGAVPACAGTKLLPRACATEVARHNVTLIGQTKPYGFGASMRPGPTQDAIMALEVSKPELHGWQPHRVDTPGFRLSAPLAPPLAPGSYDAVQINLGVDRCADTSGGNQPLYGSISAASRPFGSLHVTSSLGLPSTQAVETSSK